MKYLLLTATESRTRDTAEQTAKAVSAFEWLALAQRIRDLQIGDELVVDADTSVIAVSGKVTG